MSNLLSKNVIENIMDDIGKCQEDSGVMMSDASYMHKACMDLDERLKDINNRLDKMIKKWEEEYGEIDS